MDMEELGYFIYMNEMEHASTNTTANLFDNNSDREDDEDE